MSIFQNQNENLFNIPIHQRTLKDRYNVGKKLRDTIPRESHQLFTSNNRDPIPLVTELDKTRLPTLIPIRYQRMSTSAFAFYRGTASIMAYDLSTIPHIPYYMQICGDAHLMNFGGFASPERNIIFSINDFDETYAGPFEWDLKRLLTSFIIAGQYQNLPIDKCENLAYTVVKSYQEIVHKLSKMRFLESWYRHINLKKNLEEKNDVRFVQLETEALQRAIQKDAHYTFKKMTHKVNGERKIIDDYPLIFHPDTSIHPDFQKSVRDRFEDYRTSLSRERRVLIDKYEIIDAAMKVVGVGSVGTFCAIILLMGGKKDPLFLQLKEAQPSVLAPYMQHDPFPHEGERVLFGQKLMQSSHDILLGHLIGDSGRHFYVRQLRDVKISANIDKYNYNDMLSYAQRCARALAKAHSRSGDPAIIAGYIGKNDTFARALCSFGMTYAKQCHADYKQFMLYYQEKTFS